MPIKSLSQSSLLSFQKYSSLLAGNDPYIPVPPAYDLLETEILTGTAASVTFSSLNSTYGADYQHLEIRYVVRSSASALVDDLFIFLNNDTNNNYANHYMRGSGSNVVSGAVPSYGKLYDAGYTNTGDTAPTNSFGGGILTMLDAFDTNKYTTVRTLGAAPYLSSGGYVALTSGVWMNTDAVDTITFDLGSGSYKIGSRFSLYGLRSA